MKRKLCRECIFLSISFAHLQKYDTLCAFFTQLYMQKNCDRLSYAIIYYLIKYGMLHCIKTTVVRGFAILRFTCKSVKMIYGTKLTE